MNIIKVYVFNIHFFLAEFAADNQEELRCRAGRCRTP